MPRQPEPTARALPTAAAVYLPLDELRPNPRNPRLHGAEVERLARTILRTTWGAPIIAQRSTMRIIGGHGRLEAARRIMVGVEIDGILRGGPEHRFDRDAPAPGVVPVRLVDVSDAEADAMTLADNARALQGNDDAAAVVAMATHAFARDAAVMVDMGYGAAELDALIKSAGDAVLRDAGAVAAPRDGVEAGSADEEWKGMPEFEQGDRPVYKSLPIHFETAEAMRDFGARIGVQLTDVSRFILWPPRSEDRDVGRFSDRAYEDG